MASTAPSFKLCAWTKVSGTISVLVQADQEDTPESTYQAQFDTVPGDWTTVCIPWREFVSVKRAQVENGAPVVDPAQVRQLGLVLSRFEYNGYANQNFKCAHRSPADLHLISLLKWDGRNLASNRSCMRDHACSGDCVATPAMSGRHPMLLSHDVAISSCVSLLLSRRCLLWTWPLSR